MDAGLGCAVRAQGMEQHPWQRRAKAAGLSQKALARLLGMSEIGVSRGLRGHFKGGVPQHLKAAIAAWELMTPEQRKAWPAATRDDAVQNEKKARQPD